MRNQQLSRLDYWLQQIEASADPEMHVPPVILVGTYMDAFESPDMANGVLESVFNKFKSRFRNIKVYCCNCCLLIF